jgi:hypothetical protein
MTQHHDRHTMERMREHLARADSELETAQHFLDPGSAEGAEMDLVHAIASAREDIGEALETVRWRLGEPEGWLHCSRLHARGTQWLTSRRPRGG